MREVKQGELLNGLMPFLLENTSKEVGIRIGVTRWKYVTVLTVNIKELKLHYEEVGLPGPATMELRYIDGYQTSASASAS